MYCWIQDTPVKQAGTCPVCRREAVKFRSSQTTCGSKACRDKKYKLLKAGIDPCRESSPTAAAPKPRPRLGSREFSDFAEVQRRAGNAVAGRIGPNVLLADGKLCAVEAIRAALATGYGYEAEPTTPGQPEPGRDIDAEVVVRLLRQGEPVEDVAAQLGLEAHAVQGIADLAVVKGALPAPAARSAVPAVPAVPARPAKPETSKKAGRQLLRVAEARLLVAEADSAEVSDLLFDLEEEVAAKIAAIRAEADARRAELKARLAVLEEAKEKAFEALARLESSGQV